MHSKSSGQAWQYIVVITAPRRQKQEDQNSRPSLAIQVGGQPTVNSGRLQLPPHSYPPPIIITKHKLGVVNGITALRLRKEGARSQIQGQPGLHRETLFPNNNKTKKLTHSHRHILLTKKCSTGVCIPSDTCVFRCLSFTNNIKLMMQEKCSQRKSN